MTDNQMIIEQYNSPSCYILAILVILMAIPVLYETYKTWQAGNQYKRDVDTLRDELEQASMETNEHLEQ